jgi:ketosteroid isomerase-like protein
MKQMFVMFILTFAFAEHAFGERNQSDKKALEAFDRAWSEAGEKGDRAALVNLLADDFTGIPATVNETQSVEAAMRTFERNKATPQNKDQVSSDLFMISRAPTTATVTHRNVIATKNAPGKEETFYPRSVHFLEKRSGKWQAVSSANHRLDDYGGISSRTGKLSNKAEEIAGFKADKSVYESAEPANMNIRVAGNTAIVAGIYRTKGRDEKGQPFDRRISFTDTHIKRDGRRQVRASQGTLIR